MTKMGYYEVTLTETRSPDDRKPGIKRKKQMGSERR